MDMRGGREMSLPLSKTCLLLVLAVSLVNANVYAEDDSDDDGHEDIKEQADQMRSLLLVEDLAGLDEGGVPVDGKPLSSFLRHCDMDMECALRKARVYIKFRNEHSEVYSNLTLPNSHMDAMVNRGVVFVKGDSCSGHKVILITNSRIMWDGSLHEILQMQAYNHERLFRHQNAQRKGIVIVQDLSGFSYKHMWKTIRSGGIYLTQTFPHNIAKIIIIGEPAYFSTVWSVIRVILPSNLRERVEFLGKNWEDLPKVASGGVCDGNAFGMLRKHANRQFGSSYQESGKEVEL